jgi:hypothetical protein
MTKLSVSEALPPNPVRTKEAVVAAANKEKPTFDVVKGVVKEPEMGPPLKKFPLVKPVNVPTVTCETTVPRVHTKHEYSDPIVIPLNVMVLLLPDVTTVTPRGPKNVGASPNGCAGVIVESSARITVLIPAEDCQAGS